MNVIEAIDQRRTVRKFLNTPVEWEKVGNILMAGHYAPSAGNLQTWRFIVITDKQQRKSIADASIKQYWIEDAPVLIIMCSLPQEMERHYGERGNLYDIQSCASATQNMLLSAEEFGLKSAWIGAFEENHLKHVLDIPDNAKVHSIIALGYGDENPPKPQKYHIQDITYINSWSNKIANVDYVLKNWGGVVKKFSDIAKDEAKRESKPLIKKIAEKSKEHAEKIKEKASQLSSKIKNKQK